MSIFFRVPWQKAKKGRMIQLSFTSLCHKLCQFSYLLSYLSSSGWGIHRFLPLLRCGPRNQVRIRGIWGRFLREVSSKKWCVFVAGNFNFWKSTGFFLCLIVDWFFVIYVHSVGMIVVYFLIESKVKPNQSILVIWQIEKSDWWPLLAFFTCGMPMSLSRLSFIGRVGQSRILRKPISKFTLQ